MAVTRSGWALRHPTWQGEEGEDAQGGYTELGEGMVHPDDVHQDLL